MHDRTCDNLLDIMKKNVYTLNIAKNDDFKTRIYSDYLASYKETDFTRLGYLFKKVNHSVWFGQGLIPHKYCGRALVTDKTFIK